MLGPARSASTQAATRPPTRPAYRCTTTPCLRHFPSFPGTRAGCQLRGSHTPAPQTLRQAWTPVAWPAVHSCRKERGGALAAGRKAAKRQSRRLACSDRRLPRLAATFQAKQADWPSRKACRPCTPCRRRPSAHPPIHRQEVVDTRLGSLPYSSPCPACTTLPTRPPTHPPTHHGQEVVYA